MYVLDADTGVLLDTISTGTGSTSAPSGLAQVNAWVDSPLDNTAKRLYGGDLTGSLWRFDINNIVSPEGKEAMALASFVRGNVAQPITTRPELSEIRTGTTQIPVVTVATGKYLGLSDVNDTSIQSIYTFKDMLSASGLGNLSGAPSMVSMTLQSNTDTSKRTVSGGTIDWQTKNGWYMDLVVNNVATGERVAIDIEQQSGILRFVTILPSTQACNFGGRSWLYTLGYRDGLFLPRAENRTAGSEVSSTKLITGARTIKLKDKMASILTDESGQITIVQDPSSPSSAKALQRVSWRELDEQ